MNTHRALANALQPALAALLGMTLMFWLAWPGYFSYDSVYQYAQVRGVMPLNDQHPPLMVLAWRVLDRAWPGYPSPQAGMLFALLVIGYWSALAQLVWRLFDRVRTRWAVFMLVGLWPPAFIILCHVWKDGLVAAASLAACACIVSWRRGGSRWSYAFAVLWLVTACCLRHNAILGAAPLAIWLTWPRRRASYETHAKPSRRGLARTAVAAILVCAFMALAPPLITRLSHAHEGHAWTALALWDLAGMSVQEQRVLIPPEMIIGSLDLDDLSQSYVPYSLPALFATGKIRLGFDDNFSPTDLSALRAAWLHAVADNPGAYLKHRLAYARFQFLGYPRDSVRELAFAPERVELPFMSMHLATVDRDVPWLKFLEWLRPSPLFAGLLYVVLAIAAVAITWVRRQRSCQIAVIALSASSLANALPLFFISPSADFRYLIWSVLASLLAMALALQPPPREDALA